MDQDELIVMLSRWAREAEQRVVEKFATLQSGEAFKETNNDEER